MAQEEKDNYQDIKYEVQPPLAFVTLNRPERLNGFTARMANELIDATQRADTDDRVRCVLYRGTGRVFCVGADLTGGAQGGFIGSDAGLGANRGPSTMASHRDEGGQVALAIHRCRKPTIAVIHGAAVGIGITMTLPMDIRIVAEDAKIGFVFARRGIIPEAASSYFLPRIVGINKALEWCYSGRVFLAKDEARSQLFNYVLPANQVMDKALSLAKEIAENTSAVSIVLTKKLMWHGLDGDYTPEKAHLTDSKCAWFTFNNSDSVEGVRSFLEKRPPNFTMSPTQDLPEFYPWWSEVDVRPRL
eukprot:TRINITY_DN2259_c0_g1_i1.p1 TRINITY_DN2259_c0_g1~~TRINITY_DN2259_c0_g1_i1.p1  ORF type:complete len:303 (+),score=49.33 TRINITY_DN2259_c0_g1_i1:185-1093(+)